MSHGVLLRLAVPEEQDEALAVFFRRKLLEKVLSSVIHWGLSYARNREDSLSPVRRYFDVTVCGDKDDGRRFVALLVECGFIPSAEDAIVMGPEDVEDSSFL